MRHKHVWIRYELDDTILRWDDETGVRADGRRVWYVGYACSFCGEEGYAA